MHYTKLSIFLVVIFMSLLTGCAAPTQQPSLQEMLRMTLSRKDINKYKAFMTQFIDYARSEDTAKMLAMMAQDDRDKAELTTYIEKNISPFFSDYTEVTGNVANVINDKSGNPGYTLYDFITTSKGDKKPFAITIVETNEGFAVNNIVVNRCYKEFHRDC